VQAGYLNVIRKTKMDELQKSIIEALKLLIQYDTDLIKTQPKEECIRPDIIVHERRSGNRNNLIVIEAKKNYDAKGDREKVTDLVKSGGFRYTVGAVISYFPMKEFVKIKFFTPDGTWKKYLLNKKDFTIKETKR